MMAAYSVEKSRLDGSNKIKIKDAVRVYGVSDKYIKNALYILDNSERIAQQVFDGLETITKARRRVDEVNGKQRDIEYLERYSEIVIEDSELSDAYSHLYSLEKRQLVGIIVKNGYIKKGN